MANTSNFRDAMREVKGNSLVGPNVIANALPFLGGGLALTALGIYGGLGVLESNPQLFMTTFWVALIGNFIFFFVVRGIAQKANNSLALPLLAVYSLISGYTLSGIVYVALGTEGVGIQGVGIAALGCGVTFIAARSIGSNLSDEDGMALTQTVQLGLIALVVVLVGQLLFSVFGVYTPSWLEIAISGVGVVLFAGVSVVDFYILPRTYKDEQYLSAALSMYLTYINLFIFILRLLIAINSRD
ncbi:MAG: Bax inhibitor-1 family protein [Spirulinaceae cyanobacterium]